MTSDLVRITGSLFRGGFDAYGRCSQELDDTGWDGFPELLGAAFFLAMERRFRPGHTPAHIIRFVADAREQYDESGSEIDPRAAETLIQAALGGGDICGFDEGMLAGIEMVLLHKLITDENPSDEQLDVFLTEAETLAVQWRKAHSCL